MKELVVNANNLTVSKSTLYTQKKNGKVNIIYPKTTADQVNMSDDVSVEDKLIGMSADIYQAAQTAVDAVALANQVLASIPTLASLGGVSKAGDTMTGNLNIKTTSLTQLDLTRNIKYADWPVGASSIVMLNWNFSDQKIFEEALTLRDTGPILAWYFYKQGSGFYSAFVFGIKNGRRYITIDNPDISSNDNSVTTSWWVNQKLGTATSLTALATLDETAKDYAETLEIKKEKSIAQINTEAQQAIYMGFPYEIDDVEYRISYSLFDQINLQDLYIDALYNPEEEKELPCQNEEGERIWLSVPGEIIMDIHKYALTFKTTIRKEADEKKARIMACKTKDEVDQVLKE